MRIAEEFFQETTGIRASIDFCFIHLDKVAQTSAGVEDVGASEQELGAKNSGSTLLDMQVN